ncbi:pyridoxal phosphate-dependent decarboxylase family protein [Runella aurantiaca]|uniref:Aspartate aminotransferase family protein n=1 Tax=Runella aurantiaca TaxID=2282308 RepID=A0A369IGF2_9BACT|nr:pyridoxal-dependent decarboxylase [Runella aurantiaca]RDB05736.1 aspartate aminotransferase family protein [Runella aurantiaca]
MLQNDLSSFDAILQQVLEQGIDFLKTIDQRPTSAPHTVPLVADLEEDGKGTSAVLAEFNQRFDPLIVASSGPRSWGFVTGGATPAAVAGDWLAGVYDQNPQAIQGQGDLSALIEVETIQLLLSLFDLPETFTGGFVTGATMSNFTALAVARQWAGKQQGRDIAKEGVGKGVKIMSATPHSSAVKSLAMLGLGSQNFIKINTLVGNREAMDVADLETKIEALSGEPFILISSGGTVNTVDFDDFEAIARLKEKHNFWWHIDAAFGGFAACSPQYKHLLNGWEGTDSITVDCHKWLNVPYESAFFLVKKEHSILQVETFQNSNAPYLGNPLENFSFLNFLPENSRRLRALPAWFTLKAYGKKGYQEIVENSIQMAQLLGRFVQQSTDFELLAPTRLNNVCFTLKGGENQDKVDSFLTQLNQRGRVFMTPTVYNGKKGIRAAFVNWRTTEKDIQIAIAEMNAVLATSV